MPLISTLAVASVRGFGFGVEGVIGVGGTWDAAHKNSTLTLSGGNLIATCTAGSNARPVYGTAAFATSGAINRFSIAYAANLDDNGIGIGVGLATASVANGYEVGDDLLSAGLQANGQVYINASSIINLGASYIFTAGSTVYCEVNDALEEFRFKVDAGSFSAWVSYSSMNAGVKYAMGTTSTIGGQITLDPT